jgi:hypothetical protein
MQERNRYHSRSIISHCGESEKVGRSSSRSVINTTEREYYLMKKRKRSLTIRCKHLTQEGERNGEVPFTIHHKPPGESETGGRSS